MDGEGLLSKCLQDALILFQSEKLTTVVSFLIKTSLCYKHLGSLT